MYGFVDNTHFLSCSSRLNTVISWNYAKIVEKKCNAQRKLLEAVTMIPKFKETLFLYLRWEKNERIKLKNIIFKKLMKAIEKGKIHSRKFLVRFNCAINENRHFS